MILMSMEIERIDWGRILDELRAAGVSTYRVALLLNRDWDTVNGWRLREPRHSDGQLILKLHAEHVKTTGGNNDRMES